MDGINAALTAARALVDLAKVAIDARDDSRAKDTLTELKGKLYDITSAALDTVEKAATLQALLMTTQDELRQLQHAIEEKEGCTLTEVRPGAYAYASKAAEGRQYHHPPYFCQPCYDKQFKSLLQYLPPREDTDAMWRCPANDGHTISHPGTRLPIDYSF